ncbi:hypothetical protein [Chryseobacterium sp. Mn2064]|uniref:hypothetical protein n=1 Tax=Chryseobacterium sp. Mn2064 TaxID=3395263 RepID=UPI003BDE8B8E
MKKSYFIALCVVAMTSCSAPGDELLSQDESNNLQTLNGSNSNILAKGGFRDNPDTPSPPPSGIWAKSFYLTNPIYGFYSDLTKKHLYNTSPLPSELPKSYPGLSYYFMERLLGSADGPGPTITRWFHTGSNDLVLTTNPNELVGQSNWERRDLGTSYNGDEPGSFPIYRYFNSGKKTHFYTRDKNELGDGKDGYVYEGLAFYLKDSEPKAYRIHDGKFYQDNNTGALYVVFESTLRRIESAAVMNNLFSPLIVLPGNVDEELTGDRGPDITSSAQLVQNTNDGKIYMVDDGLYRYIPDTQTFNAFRFKESSIQRKPVRMMFVGKNIVKTY